MKSMLHFQYISIRLQARLIQIGQCGQPVKSLYPNLILIFMEHIKKVKAFDLFGNNLQLLSEGQTSYQTYYGFFGTLTIIICFVVVFFGNVVGFFRLQFLSYMTYQRIDVQQNITLNSQNFKFAISLSNYNISSDELFTVYAQQFSKYINGSSVNYEPLKLQKCKVQDWIPFGSYFQNYYNSNNMDAYLCSPPQFQLNLAGQFGSSLFNYVKIAIKPCPTNDCAKAINSFLQKNRYVEYNIIYVNKAINYSNTFEPFDNYPDRSFYRFVPYNNLFSVDQYFIPQYVQTDISVLPFENIVTNVSFQFTEQTTLTSVPYSSKDTQFFRHFFRISPIQSHVERKVQSLDDFLSFLGGIFSIFHIIGAIIFTPYAQFQFKMKVFNDSYFFKKKDQIELQKLQNPQKQDSNFLKFIFFKIFGNVNYLLQNNIFDIKAYKYCEELAQEKLDILKLIENNNYLRKSVEYMMDQQEKKIIKRLKCQAIQLQQKNEQKLPTVQQLTANFYEKKPKKKTVRMQRLISKLKGSSELVSLQSQRNLVTQNGT